MPSRRRRLSFLTPLVRKSVLLDSNLLLLLVVASMGRGYFGQFRRAAAFRFEDASVLAAAIGRFNGVLTTPPIVAEVSNLGGQAPPPLVLAFRTVLARWVAKTPERIEASKAVVSHEAFRPFGFTDATIALISKTDTTAMTVDYGLYHYLNSKGHACINFNHLRNLEEISS